MKAIYCYLIIMLMLNISKSQTLTKEQIEEALNRNKNRNTNSKIPNIIILSFKKERINDIPMFSRIIQEFLSTMGITANMGEIQGTEMIATMERGKTFDKKVLLDNFKDILENVEIADFTKG